MCGRVIINVRRQKMATTRPDWLLDSPYFEYEPEWHLKEDAPEELKQKFKEYMARTENS